MHIPAYMRRSTFEKERITIYLIKILARGLGVGTCIVLGEVPSRGMWVRTEPHSSQGHNGKTRSSRDTLGRRKLQLCKIKTNKQTQKL